MIPPIRGRESSAMQRSAKDWPRTHHQHHRPPPPPPLLLHHPFNPCKSSKSTRSGSSGRTPSVNRTDHRRPETAAPSISLCSLSGEPTLRPDSEARARRFRSTRGASIAPSRGPGAVVKNRTFPPAPQNDPMDKGGSRTPSLAVMKLCVYDCMICKYTEKYISRWKKIF